MQSLENGSTSLLSSLSLVSTGVQVWGRRSSTSATSPAAARFTGRHPTSELTCAGTAARDPSSATGCSVGRDSPGATSCRDTGGRTQVRSPVDTLFVLKLEKKEKNNNKVTVLWSELMWGSRCRYSYKMFSCLLLLLSRALVCDHAMFSKDVWNTKGKKSEKPTLHSRSSAISVLFYL